jgi:hypothetical protein
MRHASSGIQQLEQQEKAAHDSLIAEEQQCTKLLSRVSSAQEELLKSLQCLAKLPAEFKNVVIFIYQFIVNHVEFLLTVNINNFSGRY